MPSMHYHGFAIFKSEPLFLIKKTPALPEWILNKYKQISLVPEVVIINIEAVM